jgi:hypothetical protein
MKCREFCFELFGFDFLLDAREKVYLLEVNLNPAFNDELHSFLKQDMEEMTKSMTALVTESSGAQEKFALPLHHINCLQSLKN